MNSQFRTSDIETLTQPFDEGPEPSMGAKLRGLWSLALRRWPIIFSAFIAAGALGFVWLLQTTPIYTSTTQLLIDPRRERPLSKDQGIVGEMGFDTASIATELTLIRSYSVARRVVDRLRLDTDQDFLGGAKGPSAKGWLADIFGAEPQAKEAKPEPREPKAEKDLPDVTPAILGAIGAVQGATSVSRQGATYFIDISFSHPNAEVAKTLANAVAEAYLVEQLEARYQGARRAANWLNERVATVRAQLEASERALADHRAKYNLVRAQAGTLSEQQAAEINTQLVAARAQTVEKRAKYEQAQRILDGGAGIETVAVVMDTPAIASMRGQDADLARQEADLLTRYGPEHPEIVKLRAARGDVKRQISREVARTVQSLKTDYEFALKKEQSLDASLQELTGAGQDGQAVVKLRELERDAQTNKVLYESLLTRFKEAEQQTSLQTAESRVIAPAFVSSVPTYPNKKRTMIMALAFGLALGIGAAFLLEQIESGFLTVEQLELAAQLPSLAIVPSLDERERTVEGRALSIPDYVVTKPLSRFGESIRSVRVSALMSNIDAPPKLILVTSSVPSEGKSTVVQSIALSTAASGQRVLLIDCDLRHPSTSKFFKAHEGPGLTDLLMGQVTADKAFIRGPIPSLTIVPAGTSTRNPPDILSSERFRSFLASVRETFDVVYIDAPPIAPVIDSSIISRAVDKVIYVVRWRTTPRDIVLRSLQSIDNSRQKIAGLVLNDAKLGQMASYSSYYSYYHKKYQKYYSS